jgi:hypothetical protein
MTSSWMPTEAVQRFQLEMVGLPLLKPDSYLYVAWHLLAVHARISHLWSLSIASLAGVSHKGERRCLWSHSTLRIVALLWRADRLGMWVRINGSKAWSTLPLIRFIPATLPLRTSNSPPVMPQGR